MNGKQAIAQNLGTLLVNAVVEAGNLLDIIGEKDEKIASLSKERDEWKAKAEAAEKRV